MAGAAFPVGSRVRGKLRINSGAGSVVHRAWVSPRQESGEEGWKPAGCAGRRPACGLLPGGRGRPRQQAQEGDATWCVVRKLALIAYAPGKGGGGGGPASEQGV